MSIASKTLKFQLNSAKNMFDFLQATEMSYEYGTDFSNFIENDIKEVFENFLHFENDVLYNLPNRFDNKGNCRVNITIYSDCEDTRNKVCLLIDGYIREKVAV
jgi:hypothetical protein